MTAVPLYPLHRQPEPSKQVPDIARHSTGARQVEPAAMDPRIKEAASQFEAVFLRQMLSSLEKTTSSATGGQSGGGSIYGSMVVNTVADAIAKAGGIGLADMLTKSLQMNQQGAPRPHNALTPASNPGGFNQASGATIRSGNNGEVRRQ